MRASSGGRGARSEGLFPLLSQLNFVVDQATGRKLLLMDWTGYRCRTYRWILKINQKVYKCFSSCCGDVDAGQCLTSVWSGGFECSSVSLHTLDPCGQYSNSNLCGIKGPTCPTPPLEDWAESELEAFCLFPCGALYVSPYVVLK